MDKIQTECVIQFKDKITEGIKKVTDNQIKILEFTNQNSEMLLRLLTSQGIFKTSDNQNTKELYN